MKTDRELELIRELGQLRKSFSLCDESEANKKIGERIKEIMSELNMKPSKPRASWTDRSARSVKW